MEASLDSMLREDARSPQQIVVATIDADEAAQTTCSNLVARRMDGYLLNYNNEHS